MLEDRLEKFTKENKIEGKGPLSVMLVITRRAIKEGLPMDPERQLTKGGGQVFGLSKANVQAILRDYGIAKVLAEEAGRTSRGSIKKMRTYVAFLNKLHADDQADMASIEKWWVERVRKFFARRPFKLKIDHSKSLRAIIADLLLQAQKRQRESTGTMYVGAVMQHLVGAKLELALPSISIEHHGASVADAPRARNGDFLIGDAAVHVTTAPTEALLRKCSKNIDANLRPIIVTTQDGASGANALAGDFSIQGRLDILEIEQFVATNIYEISGFEQSKRPLTVRELVEKYNKIVETCETDPSLKIEIA